MWWKCVAIGTVSFWLMEQMWCSWFYSMLHKIVIRWTEFLNFFLLNFMSCFDKMQELSVPYTGNVHKPPGIWAGAQRGPLSASHHFAFLIVAVSVSFYIFSFEGGKKEKVQRKWGRTAAHKHMALEGIFFPLHLPITPRLQQGRKKKQAGSDFTDVELSGLLSPTLSWVEEFY